MSSQPLCCTCNGSRARCVRCLCARRGNPCTNCTARSCQNTTEMRTSTNTATPTESQDNVQAQSVIGLESREPPRQPNPPREVLPLAAHSLPTYDRARDDYIWGDRSAEVVTPLMEAAYQEVMHWRPNLFVPPVGKAANDLVSEMTRLITNFVEKTAFERIALTAFFLLPHLVLQLPASRRAAAKRKAMLRRMEMWRAGKIFNRRPSRGRTSDSRPSSFYAKQNRMEKRLRESVREQIRLTKCIRECFWVNFRQNVDPSGPQHLCTRVGESIDFTKTKFPR